MFDDIRKFLTSKKARRMVDARNVALYVFGIIVLAIAWSGAKTVQNNYQLQKKVSSLQQQNAVLHLQNNNTFLQNQFYDTDVYKELSARQNLGLAAPGEKVLVISKSVAMKYVDKALGDQRDNAIASIDNRPTYTKNLEAWRDFLLGRPVSTD
ncbi:septum formation initiator family protein [Candidatus Saccharibacteria bacterium]|nr:septum formation initiator family protein [Candidatus Saccharibacteria bacterium]